MVNWSAMDLQVVMDLQEARLGLLNNGLPRLGQSSVSLVEMEASAVKKQKRSKKLKNEESKERLKVRGKVRQLNRKRVY